MMSTSFPKLILFDFLWFLVKGILGVKFRSENLLENGNKKR